MKRYWITLVVLLMAGWLVACSGTDYQNDDKKGTPTDGDTPDGDTPDGDELPEFTSAGTGNGSYDETPDGGNVTDGDAPSDDDKGEGADREIVESDLFRVVENYIYALNQFRGLAVVDFSDAEKPRIVSRLPLRGYPKEMFVDDGVAVILLTNLVEKDAENGRSRQISDVVTVDVSDPANPALIETFKMNGTIVDSRKVGDIVYVVASVYPWWYWCEGGSEDSATIEIASVNVADPDDVRLADTESFAGQGWAVYVTQNALYVAETPYDYWDDATGSKIHYVDISDPAGAMEKRGTFQAQGKVLDRFKMFQKDNTFVVVSVTNTWNGNTFLETYDVTDPSDVTRQAALPIMENEQLYASRFSGDRAYIVTFEQTDPLFVAEFSNPAAPTMLGELEIPGWSTHMEIRGDKIYAVGVDNVDGWRTKVSLFDVADPADPKELDVVSIGEEGSYSWSEALYDWKAFKIYDDKGFMLVPSSGWDQNWFAYVNKLYLIDFTETSLTLRGSVASETPIKRGFVAGDYLASLSETALQIIDYSDRDKLEVLAEVTLASFVYQLKRCGEVLCTTDNGYWTSNSKLRLFDPKDPGDAPYWQSPILTQQFGYGASASLLTNDANPRVYLTAYDGWGWWGEDVAMDRALKDEEPTRKIYGFDLTDPKNPVSLGEGAFAQDNQGYYYGYNMLKLLPNDILVNSGKWTWDDRGERSSQSLIFSDLADLENVKTIKEFNEFSPLFPWQEMPVDGANVWATDCDPIATEDSRPAVKCFAVKIDASDKTDIKEAARFNTPGQVVAISPDKTRLLSMDRQFTGRRDSYLTCKQSLRVLAMNGDRPTGYLGEIPLTTDDYCYWLGYDDGRPEDGDIPEPADGDTPEPADGDEIVDGGSSEGEDTPSEPPTSKEPPPVEESYTYLAGWYVMGDRVYVLTQTYGYGYEDEPTNSCGDYYSRYSMNVKIYALSDLSVIDSVDLENIYSASSVNGGGILLTGTYTTETTAQYRLVYMTADGEMTELEAPENDGTAWYYNYYGASVRIADTLYVPNGWYGIQTFDLAD